MVTPANQYLIIPTEVHEGSGLSHPDAARASDLDPCYVYCVLICDP